MTLPHPMTPAADTFRGDNAHLCECIAALLSLDAAGAIKPHGIGGHARTLLTSAAARIAALEGERDAARDLLSEVSNNAWGVNNLDALRGGEPLLSRIDSWLTERAKATLTPGARHAG